MLFVGRSSIHAIKINNTTLNGFHCSSNVSYENTRKEENYYKGFSPDERVKCYLKSDILFE